MDNSKEPSSSTSTQFESDSIDVTEPRHPTRTRANGPSSVMDGPSALLAMDHPVNFHPTRSILICGALCGLGILGINRYARCPAKRRYGRLGLASAAAIYTYNKSVHYDGHVRLREQFKDEQCRPIITEWLKWALYIEVTREHQPDVFRALRERENSLEPGKLNNVYQALPSDERRLIGWNH
ncbi:hypothetical protein BXZ70DRAFT_1011208 [Cristinia sonorae]|uniref:Uncharacterized protein n=1 Tax=Cristinia sonorae TaxID=1940300 RepID=A0A8K0UGZ2_9AGAR|nr:hypothetical protein BXZ70DRAFT_1011208 [Cristinia sonorae]